MTMHLTPYDCEARFSHSHWGFTLTFHGRKGANDDGAHATVVLHFTASWIEMLVRSLKGMLTKQRDALTEHEQAFKL